MNHSFCHFQKVDDFVIRRFYLTLVIYELWKQRTVWDVADAFQQSRGFIQNLLSSAASFASCVFHFCQVRSLVQWDMADAFQQSRGFIQNLLSSAASFASCVFHFCQVRSLVQNSFVLGFT